nr:MAG TPA: hypothetical protein [Caudoviricetes sp.]
MTFPNRKYFQVPIVLLADSYKIIIFSLLTKQPGNLIQFNL